MARTLDHDAEGLGLYLQQAGRTPLLGAAEEVELSRAARNGCSFSRQRLVASNLRLVVSIARRHAGRGVALVDLVAEGNLGLVRAVGGFDPERGFRFSTYAVWWIEKAVRMTVRRDGQGRAVRVPSNMLDKLTAWRRHEERLHQDLGRHPTEAETRRASGTSRRTALVIRDARRALAGGVHSLDAETEAGGSLAASLSDGEGRLLDALARREELARLAGLLDTLSPRQRDVLRLRFGLDGGPPRELSEIAASFSLSAERIRQIQNEATAKLRVALEGAVN